MTLQCNSRLHEYGNGKLKLEYKYFRVLWGRFIFILMKTKQTEHIILFRVVPCVVDLMPPYNILYSISFNVEADIVCQDIAGDCWKTLRLLYSHEQLYIHIYICMQNHNDDTIKTSRHSSLEKYTSHFIWRGSKGWLKVLLWEGWVGDRTKLQYIDPHSYGHNSVSLPFSWAAQPVA